MNKFLILFFYLIKYINLFTITRITPNSLESLPTEDPHDSYFYLETSKFSYSETIFLYFQDDKYNFNQNLFTVCYTDLEPNLTSIKDKCYFEHKNARYSSNVNSPILEYFYNIPYKKYSGQYTFLIVNYTGEFSSGHFSVQITDNELYRQIQDKVEDALYQVILGFIILASIFGFLIAVIIVFSVLICLRLRKINEGYELIYSNKGNDNSNMSPLIPLGNNNQNNEQQI